MTCDRWRDAISACADGEDLGVDRRLLDAHMARCPGCQRFAETVTTTQTARIALVPPPAGLPRRVARLAAAADRAAARNVVRVLLAVVAVEIVALSIPALLGDETATSTHSARHLGAFSAAYGVGLLVVVARPARARTMLPVAAVLAGAMMITSVVDLAERRIPLIGEAYHLPELASVVLVWLIAVPSRRRPVDEAAANVDRRPALRVVDDHRAITPR